jgi:lipooligosaccharide transport system ATP-binding protein
MKPRFILENIVITIVFKGKRAKMEQIIIKISNLYKTYDHVIAVDRLDFAVRQSECFGLLGPNGAGKTTTLKIIYGKAKPTPYPDTIIDVFGYHPARDALTIKSFSGIVPQEDNLDTELNVTDNLLIYAKFYGMSRQAANLRISELLNFMELEDKAQVKIRQLSGGMQRRLTIARALLNQPRLLILDEPTTGLDPQVRHLIWNKIRELKEMGVTVLLTTHYMDEAFQICDRIIIMDQGHKILEGSPGTLLNEHLEKYVMEVYLPDYKSANLMIRADETKLRRETFADTAYFFSDDPQRLSELARNLDSDSYRLRESNLEDLFLKVTGRGLNELQ